MNKSFNFFCGTLILMGLIVGCGGGGGGNNGPSLTDHLTPVQAGARISRTTSSGLPGICSLGFFANRVSKVGMVTALHCTEPADLSSSFETFSQSDDANTSYDFANVTKKAPFTSGAACLNADYCFETDALFAELFSQTPKNAAVAHVPLNQNHPVSSLTDKYIGTTAVVAGDTVTGIGATTGKHQGNVTETFYIARAGNYFGKIVKISNLTCASFLSQGGDSGGVVLQAAGNNTWNLAGVTSVSRPNASCFTPVARATAALGANVAY
jgi:hypothetical protein